MPPLPHALPAAVSCAWGYTTTGGAKGVGESTTSAVVISLVLIFVFDFALRCGWTDASHPTPPCCLLLPGGALALVGGCAGRPPAWRRACRACSCCWPLDGVHAPSTCAPAAAACLHAASCSSKARETRSRRACETRSGSACREPASSAGSWRPGAGCSPAALRMRHSISCTFGTLTHLRIPICNDSNPAGAQCAEQGDHDAPCCAAAAAHLILQVLATLFVLCSSRRECAPIPQFAGRMVATSVQQCGSRCGQRPCQTRSIARSAAVAWRSPGQPARQQRQQQAAAGSRSSSLALSLRCQAGGFGSPPAGGDQAALPNSREECVSLCRAACRRRHLPTPPAAAGACVPPHSWPLCSNPFMLRRSHRRQRRSRGSCRRRPAPARASTAAAGVS